MTLLFEKLILLVVAIVIIGCSGAYMYYIWSDCLNENNVFTCMRMLNK